MANFCVKCFDKVISIKQSHINVNNQGYAIRMKNLIACLPAIRAPFLLLAPICVFLGLSISHYHHVEFQLVSFILTLIAALFSAIAVNCLNEYQDFHSGLDLITTPTPFSGGSGLLKTSPHLASNVLKIANFAATIVLLVGLYFTLVIGSKVIPLGMLGAVIIFTYTKWLNKTPFLCLIAPGLGFGLLIVNGSYLTQTLSYSNDVWLISLIPFFLINNLLLINQFPDIQADKKSGRNHLPIKYGTKIASVVYLLFAIFSAILLGVLIMKKVLPFISAVCFLPLLLNFIAFPHYYLFGEKIAEHPNAMILNVLSANITPLLLAISLLIAG